MRCGSCQGIFLLGAMKVEISIKSGFRDRCPRCASIGPFHTPTVEEIAAVAAPDEFTAAVPEAQSRPLTAIAIAALVSLAVWWWLR